MNSIQEFWKLLLEHFEKTNSEFTFNHWIKPAEPIRIEQNILYIKVPSTFTASACQYLANVLEGTLI